MAQSVILHLESVSKQFSRTANPAVQSVNLTLYQGDILGFAPPFCLTRAEAEEIVVEEKEILKHDLDRAIGLSDIL